MMRRKSILAAGLITLAAGPAFAQNGQATPDYELDVFTKVFAFEWEEIDPSGAQFLREDGPMLAVGARWRENYGSNYFYTLEGEVFGNEINYTGQTQSGTPTTTETGYLGWSAGGRLGWDFIPRTEKYQGQWSTSEIFLGYKFTGWERDIKSTPAAKGYVENWETQLAQAGARVGYALARSLELYAEGGVQSTWHTKESIDLTALGFATITLEPGDAVSFFAEAGLSWEFLTLAAFYEEIRFDRSPLDAEFQAFYQPESKAAKSGVTLMLRFAYQ